MILGLKKNLTKIWLFVTISAVLYYIFLNADLIKSLNQELDSLSMLYISLFIFISKISSYVLTSFFIKKNTNQLKFLPLMSFSSINQIMKYIPGGFWHYLNRYLVYKNNFNSTSIDGTKKYKNLVFEISIFTSTGVLLSFLTFFSIEAFFSFQSYGYLYLVYFFSILIFFISSYYLYKIYFNKLIMSEIILINSLGILMHLTISYSLFLLLNFFQVNISFPETVLINTISTLFGYYVFFAPGGIGARELCFMYTSSFFGNDTSSMAYILILHRILIILIEVFIFFMFFLINFIFNKNNKVVI